MICAQPGLGNPELSRKLGVPVKTIERWLKSLKDKKLIEFKGADKTGGYYVVERGEQ